MILDATIQAVKDVNVIDVISHYVDMKRKGANYLGLCPFHDEKTGSFTVSPAKNMYKCFGCGKGGDAIKFVMDYEGKTYPEAIELIAGLNNILVETTEKSTERTKRTLTKLKKAVKQVATFDTIPLSLLPESKDHIYKNPLTKQLAGIFGGKIVEAVLDEYEIVINGNWLVFPQIDIKGRCRTAKGIKYQNNGHRDHEALPMWLHSSLKNSDKLPESFSLKQCFTGEVLINRFPQKSIAIVEGQSTALYMACLSLAAQKNKIKSLEYFTRFIFICTGGSDGIGWKNEGISNVLRGRKVIAFPDAGFYNQWLNDAEELRESGIIIGVSDFIEKKFEQGLLSYNDDLRDFFEPLSDEIRCQCSIINIDATDVFSIPVLTNTGSEYDHLIMATIWTRDGKIYDSIYSSEGELITSHPKIETLSTFFNKSFQQGFIDGKEALLNVVNENWQ